MLNNHLESKISFKKAFSKVAFTLAEVLIVLGIIGIIAEMTIPTLMNDVQNKSNITAWKKAYTVFSQAYLQLRNDGGPDWNSHTEMKNSFVTYFKTLKSCDASGSDCWHNAGVAKSLPLGDGTQYAMPDISPDPGLVTVDGMKAVFYRDSATQGWVMIDVNGDKKPNVEGKDIFGLRFNDTGSTDPFTYSEFGTCNPPSAGAAGTGYIGMGCSLYYILNG